MIPLIFLALVLSAALATYEFSPKTHAWVDDHVRAVREALAAHQAADAQLAAAKAAPDPDTAAQHARAADAANRAAAQGTAEAAKTAKTDAQRQVAAQSAVVVADRGREIAHVRLIHEAYGAHQAADAHLAASSTAPDPATAAQHAAEASAANQVADQKSAGAAQAAKTDAQRDAAAQSAQVAAGRESQIKAALASLGVGECGVHTYAGVTSQKKDALLAKLHGAGMAVTGDNPWSVDTNKADVKLRAIWDPATQVMKLIVTSSAVWAPCSAIWAEIDPTVKEIVGP